MEDQGLALQLDTQALEPSLNTCFRICNIRIWIPALQSGCEDDDMMQILCLAQNLRIYMARAQ